MAGLVHRAEKRSAVEPFADAVFVGESAAGGPYDLILESVGGAVFANVLKLLAEDGMLVTYGTSAERTSTIEVAPFYLTGGLSIYGFYLFREVTREPVSGGLARLADLLAAGKLDVRVHDVLPIARIGDAAERLWNRGVTGKLVVTF